MLSIEHEICRIGRRRGKRLCMSKWMSTKRYIDPQVDSDMDGNEFSIWISSWMWVSTITQTSMRVDVDVHADVDGEGEGWRYLVGYGRGHG